MKKYRLRYSVNEKIIIVSDLTKEILLEKITSLLDRDEVNKLRITSYD